MELNILILETEISVVLLDILSKKNKNFHNRASNFDYRINNFDHPQSVQSA